MFRRRAGGCGVSPQGGDGPVLPRLPQSRGYPRTRSRHTLACGVSCSMRSQFLVPLKNSASHSTRCFPFLVPLPFSLIPGLTVLEFFAYSHQEALVFLRAPLGWAKRR